MMSVTYFENQLEITPALANNSHCIALLNATTLNVGEFDLPHYLSPFELNVINRRKVPSKLIGASIVIKNEPFNSGGNLFDTLEFSQLCL